MRYGKFYNILANFIPLLKQISRYPELSSCVALFSGIPASSSYFWPPLFPVLSPQLWKTDGSARGPLPVL